MSREKWQVRRDEMAGDYADRFDPDFYDVLYASHVNGQDAGRRYALTEEKVIKDLVEAVRHYAKYIEQTANAHNSALHRSLAAYDKLIKENET